MNKFKVNKAVIEGNVNKCLVCGKKFKLGEDIVLAPIQKPKKGFETVMCIPIHTKCYWV